jgi:hypothetical protein
LGSGSVPSLCWSLVSVYSFGIIIMKHTTACIHYTIVLMKFVIRIFLYLNFLYTLGTLFVFSVPRLYEDHQVFVFSIHPSREYITFIGPKKNTCGSGSQPTLLFFQRDWLCDTLFSLGGCGLLIQCAKMAVKYSKFANITFSVFYTISQPNFAILLS